jgi:hypothetical protein
MKVSEAQAEADIKRERAAEIAARTDLLRNKNVEKLCDLVDDQFSDADPELAKNLKLAKFLESNPGIAAQVEKVLTIRERLEREKGVRVEPSDGSSFPLLPPRQVSDSSDNDDPPRSMH